MIGVGFERMGKLYLRRIEDDKLWVEVKSDEDEGCCPYNWKGDVGMGLKKLRKEGVDLGVYGLAWECYDLYTESEKQNLGAE
ncbi:unnamed protein product [Dovyalis caffra]|uniref:Uncharacterized protein n=1 Tax=Dovyalis caffra TaxID=77055 RepID=A0AAV1RNN1_9ROSI|nr:unnamed protein product [Dovyalis caffra]